MEDHEIIMLYWRRCQDAIPASAEKYGAYCGAIARNILGSPEDAEECVNDTWWNAWNAIPPNRPMALGVFLGKITRNLAFNRYKYAHAEKRGGGQIPLVLEELAGCVSGGDSTQQLLDRRELIRAINAFLDTLPREKRSVFLCRYWYSDSIADIAARFGRTENNVSVTLNRLRRKLREYLSERGFEL